MADHKTLSLWALPQLWVVLVAAVVVMCPPCFADEGLSVCRVDVVRSLPFPLHYPAYSESIHTDVGCKVEVPMDLKIQVNVSNFFLAGEDPCSPNDEHLSIIFPESNHYSRGSVDTIQWCGGSYSPLLVLQGPFTLHYMPGVDDRRQGRFNILLSNLMVPNQCPQVKMKVGREAMYIYSPGYPAPYDSNLPDCNWELKSENDVSLKLDSLRFDVEAHSSCNYDYLKIDRRKYCGDQRVTAVSRLSNMSLFFSSDHTDTGAGFVFRVVENSRVNAACGEEITLGSRPVTLKVSSTETTASINCVWTLDAGSNNHAIFLETTRFETLANGLSMYIKLEESSNFSSIGTPSHTLYSGSVSIQPFQTFRTSLRYLRVEVEAFFSELSFNIEFTVTSLLRDAVPQVLYAGTAPSYVWLNLNTMNNNTLGVLVRGKTDHPDNYVTCITLEAQSRPFYNSNLNISDFFSIYSGWNSSFSDLRNPCGVEIKSRVTSHGSKVFLDWTPRNISLWIKFSQQTSCTPDKIPLYASETSKNLSSVKNSYGQYSNNVFCRWIVSSTALFDEYTKVKALQSRLTPTGCQDNITFYEGQDYQNKLLDMCGSETPVVLSSLNKSLLVEFRTNYRDTDRGFTLEYSSDHLRDECPTMATLNANDTPKNLTSPNYPNLYPNNLNCWWRIQSTTTPIKLTLLFLSIAQDAQTCVDHDSLVIYDGPTPGSEILLERCGNGFIDSEFVGEQNYMLVHFKSDSSHSARGFMLQYQRLPSPQWRCNLGMIVTEDEPGEITSKYYPMLYPSDLDCYWLVKTSVGRAVTLEVEALDVPSCLKSPVILYDGDSEDSLMLARLCETSVSKRYTSSGNTMFVRFAANGNRDRGFKLRLTSSSYFSSDNPCGGNEAHLVAYADTTNYIQSPNYPGEYPPDADCNWRIESTWPNMSVRLEVQTLRLESSFTCNFDSISIYDGQGQLSVRLAKLCNDERATFWSSGRYMFIKFVSDSTSQYSGFRLAYRAVSVRDEEIPTSHESSSGTSTGAVVGGVFGAVIFLLFGMTLIVCIIKRCRDRRSTAGHRSSQRDNRNNASTVFVMSPVIVNQMPPPAYPGITNGGFIYDERTPGGLRLPPPPLYAELDAPPPYSEAMLESHPPSSPKEEELPPYSPAGVAIQDRRAYNGGQNVSSNQWRQDNGRAYNTREDSPAPCSTQPEQENLRRRHSISRGEREQNSSALHAMQGNGPVYDNRHGNPAPSSSQQNGGPYRSTSQENGRDPFHVTAQEDSDRQNQGSHPARLQSTPSQANERVSPPNDSRQENGDPRTEFDREHSPSQENRREPTPFQGVRDETRREQSTSQNNRRQTAPTDNRRIELSPSQENGRQAAPTHYRRRELSPSQENGRQAAPTHTRRPNRREGPPAQNARPSSRDVVPTHSRHDNSGAYSGLQRERGSEHPYQTLASASTGAAPYSGSASQETLPKSPCEKTHDDSPQNGHLHSKNLKDDHTYNENPQNDYSQSEYLYHQNPDNKRSARRNPEEGRGRARNPGRAPRENQSRQESQPHGQMPSEPPPYQPDPECHPPQPQPQMQQAQTPPDNPSLVEQATASEQQERESADTESSAKMPESFV